MTLLECLKQYELLLLEYGRREADKFLENAVDEELHSHIKACFNDDGSIVLAVPYAQKEFVFPEPT